MERAPAKTVNDAQGGDEQMGTLPLKALWVGEKPIAFAGGSTLDTDLRTLTVQSLDVRLPFGGGEKVSVRVELTNGKTYEGHTTTKMPRDVGSRGAPTIHVYEFSAKSPLSPAN
jgi:hypothetical protein